MRRYVMGGLLLAAVACVPVVSVTRFDQTAYPVTPDSMSVRVFSDQTPTCAFTELGTVESGGEWQRPDALMVAMQQKVREIGGHAIIRYRQTNKLPNATPAAMSGWSISGVAIRFKSDDCRQ